ncbi:MAG: FtsQ-type POTRA domain-containing protein [Pseudomonadota bacterium]
MTREKRHIRKNTSKTATSARQLRWRTAAGRILTVVAIAATLPTVALGCILAHDLITQGAYTRIRHTEISGTHRLSHQDIIRQAAIPEALNLLGVNLRVIRQRLMAHPWIAEASVSRHFPDRLVIHIREQQPVAQVVMEDQWYLANAAGTFFIAGENLQPGIPVVTGITTADLDTDGRLPGAIWQTLMTAIRYDAPNGNGSRGALETHIAYDRDIGVSVLATPLLGTIHLGTPPAADAFVLAERIAAYLSLSGYATGFSAIDMRNPNRIVVAPSPMAERREKTHEENKNAA